MNTGNVTHQPQQARSQQKLDRILAAAREVVSEQGFELATINEITARAGVAVGTFYTRFENKDALLHALHAQQTEAAAGRLAIALGAVAVAPLAGDRLPGNRGADDVSRRVDDLLAVVLSR